MGSRLYSLERILFVLGRGMLYRCDLSPLTPDGGTNPYSLLETESYTTTIRYDALGRIREQQNPDTSITRQEYHLSGNLDRVTVRMKGETSFTEFVTGITCNPRGQREAITYGNGVATAYAYERETFRLTSLVTTRSGDSRVLQDLSYTYDPAGNITLVNDASIPCVFNNNQQVDPKQKYTYDALYRLIEAEGREHIALNNPDYYKDPNSFKQSAFIHLTDPNDDNKLANYTRYYGYDTGGNLTAIQHVAADSQRSFTREINVDAASNRWLPANMGPDPDYGDYYDANGNITELEHLGGIAWNYRDSISSAVLLEREGGPNDAEYYVYDSAGQRVRRVKETLRTVGVIEYEEKIYLGNVEIKKIRANSTEELQRSTLHVMDDRKRIAVSHNWSLDTNYREVNGPTDLDVNKTRYQYGNHLDSASLELDTAGAIISYEEYFPYGDTSFIAGTNLKEVKLKEYRYTGKEKDDSTGLYYFGARYYASWVGRWMSCDPLFRENPAVYERPKAKDEEEKRKQEDEFRRKLYDEGVNLYGYVKGNPVTMSDPNGMESFLDFASIGNPGVNLARGILQNLPFGGSSNRPQSRGAGSGGVGHRPVGASQSPNNRNRGSYNIPDFGGGALGSSSGDWTLGIPYRGNARSYSYTQSSINPTQATRSPHGEVLQAANVGQSSGVQLMISLQFGGLIAATINNLGSASLGSSLSINLIISSEGRYYDTTNNDIRYSNTHIGLFASITNMTGADITIGRNRVRHNSEFIQHGLFSGVGFNLNIGGSEFQNIQSAYHGFEAGGYEANAGIHTLSGSYSYSDQDSRGSQWRSLALPAFPGLTGYGYGAAQGRTWTTNYPLFILH